MSEYKPLNKESNLSRFRTGIVLVLMVVAYFLVHYAMPYTEAYYAKSIMRKACNDKIQEDLRQWPEEKSRWRQNMLGKLRAHGIRPEEDHYSLEEEAVIKLRHYRCEARIAFQLTSDWGIIGDFFEMKPFITTHRAHIKVDYKR